MVLFFAILILLSCVILGFIVLVQNPKGGGLSGNIAGFSNQFMGVKQTTDVLEKGTWIFATIVALLCIFSAFFIPQNTKGGNDLMDGLNTKPTNSQPAAPAPVTPPPPAQK